MALYWVPQTQNVLGFYNFWSQRSWFCWSFEMYLLMMSSIFSTCALEIIQTSYWWCGLKVFCFGGLGMDSEIMHSPLSNLATAWGNVAGWVCIECHHLIASLLNSWEWRSDWDDAVLLWERAKEKVFLSKAYVVEDGMVSFHQSSSSSENVYLKRISPAWFYSIHLGQPKPKPKHCMLCLQVIYGACHQVAFC